MYIGRAKEFYVMARFVSRGRGYKDPILRHTHRFLVRLKRKVICFEGCNNR